MLFSAHTPHSVSKQGWPRQKSNKKRRYALKNEKYPCKDEMIHKQHNNKNHTKKMASDKKMKQNEQTDQMVQWEPLIRRLHVMRSRVQQD